MARTIALSITINNYTLPQLYLSLQPDKCTSERYRPLVHFDSDISALDRMIYDAQKLTAMLVPFYLGEQPDAEGRKIQAIWAWDFEDLKCTHDYIQWLFPIAEQSKFNINAPVVDAEIVRAFQSDRRLRQNLRKSFVVMLRFYGLQYHWW